MTPIWASDALLPPGSISPIAQFAPAGSVYTVRTLNPIAIRAQRNDPAKEQRSSPAKTAGLTSQSSNTQSGSFLD